MKMHVISIVAEILFVDLFIVKIVCEEWIVLEESFLENIMSVPSVVKGLQTSVDKKTYSISLS